MVSHFIFYLSPSKRKEFDLEVRECGYGKHLHLVNWLAINGVKSSRSSVHRYTSELRRQDNINGSAASLRLSFSQKKQMIGKHYESKGLREIDEILSRVLIIERKINNILTLLSK